MAEVDAIHGDRTSAKAEQLRDLTEAMTVLNEHQPELVGQLAYIAADLAADLLALLSRRQAAG